MGSVMPVQCVISCMTCCADILYYCVVYWIYDLISCVLADGCFTQVYGRLWSYAEVTILYIMLILDGSRMFNLNFCCMLRLRTSTLYLCALRRFIANFCFMTSQTTLWVLLSWNVDSTWCYVTCRTLYVRMNAHTFSVLGPHKFSVSL